MDDSAAANVEKDDIESSSLAGNPVSVEPLLWLLLNEAPIVLQPKLAMQFDLTQGLFLSQLIYWLGKSKETLAGKRVRFSYTKWQRQFPFLSRTWIIKLVQRLEEQGVIKVHRGKRVNRIELLLDLEEVMAKKPEHQPESDEPTPGYDKYDAAITVFGTLAKAVGLRKAIMLQQVHIRTYGRTIDDFEYWAQKSCHRWHEECLMFISERTLKRLFEQLVDADLLLMTQRPGPGGIESAYRVNYERLKALMAGQTTYAPVIDWEKSAKNYKQHKEQGIAVPIGAQNAYGSLKYKKRCM